MSVHNAFRLGVDPGQVIVDRLHARRIFGGDNDRLALALIGNTARGSILPKYKSIPRFRSSR